MPVNEFLGVQIGHSGGDLFGPINDDSGHDLLSVAKNLVQLAVRTELHDDAVTWSLRTNAPAMGGESGDRG